MTPVAPPADASEAAERAPEAAVERVIVTADALTWVGGQLRATGHVRIVAGTNVLVAASATGTAELLQVTDGVWSRPDGDVRFATAEVRLSARSGVVTDAQLTRDGATLTASRVTFEAGGDLAAGGAWLEPCHCADGGRAALSFRAAKIELLQTHVAVIHGGTVRVFDVPVLPVPYWREPLDPKHFRLLFPQLGFGSLGWSASEHARFGLGPELIEVGPAWREDRGGRAELALSGPVRLDGALGWDAQESTVRGGVATQGGFADPQRRLAWDATLQSDAAYAEDYSPRWVDRGVAWHDSRLLASWGPIRATGWLPEDAGAGNGVAGDYATLRFRPEFGGADWAVAPRVEARASAPLRFLTGTDLRASHTWTALHLDLVADAATDLSTAAGTAAVARAEVPFWVDFNRHPVQLFAGLRGDLAYGDRTLVSVPTALPLGESLATAVGPEVRASAVVGTLVLSGEGAGLLDATGSFLPGAVLSASSEDLTIRVDLSAERQLVQLQSHGLVAVDAGALVAADTALGWGDLTLHPGRLVVGGGVSRGFTATSLLAGTARLGYDDGCSSLILTAAFSPDRELPDFGAQLVLRK